MNETLSDYLSEINQINERASSVKDDILASKTQLIQAIASKGLDPNVALNVVGQITSSLGDVMLERGLEPYLKMGFSKAKGALSNQLQDFVANNDVANQISSFVNDASAITNIDPADVGRNFVNRIFTRSRKGERLTNPADEAGEEMQPVLDLPIEQTAPEPAVPEPQERSGRELVDKPVATDPETEQIPLQDFSKAEQAIEQPAQIEETQLTGEIQQETGLSDLTEADIMSGKAIDEVQAATETAEAAIEEGAADATGEAAASGIADALGPETGGIGLLVGTLIAGAGALTEVLSQSREKREAEEKEQEEEAEITQAQTQIQQTQAQAQQQIAQLSRPTMQLNI